MNQQKEGYPIHWWHCTIHLNSKTGEMHSGGDHRVRIWLEKYLKKNRKTPERLVCEVKHQVPTGVYQIKKEGAK